MCARACLLRTNDRRCPRRTWDTFRPLTQRAWIGGLLVGLLTSCGGEPTRSLADARSCLREGGAEVEPEPLRGNRFVPPATRAVEAARWRGGGEAVIHYYDDEGAAERADQWLAELVSDFQVEREQVRRTARFVVFLGPAEQPKQDEQDTLFDCIGSPP